MCHINVLLKYNSGKVAPSSEERSGALQLSRICSGGGGMCDRAHVCLQVFPDKEGQRCVTLADPLLRCWWHEAVCKEKCICLLLWVSVR